MKSNPELVAAVVASLLPATSLGQLPEDLRRKFDEAERRIVRLPPTAFRTFPAMWSGNSKAGDAAYPKKHSRRSRTMSLRVNLRDPVKWIGRFCAPSKAFPR